MTHRARLLAALLLLALGQGIALPAAARDDEGISSEQAAAIVRRAYDGRVVSVQAEGKSGQGGWKVRVLLDGGRVKTVVVDSHGSIRGAD